MTSTTIRRNRTVNTRRRILVAGLILLLIAIALGVFLSSAAGSSPGQLSGNILLWHALSSSGTEAMELVVSEFEELNPQTTVHLQTFSSQDELLAQYREAVLSGLGPDLLVGDAGWVNTLAQVASIRSIEDELNPDLLDQYLPVAVDSLRHDDVLYGLPLSLHVPALYYNADFVETPPETLDALLTQAAEGHTVLLNTQFRDAFWGLQAFGGRFLDEEGRAILDQGGYANWLDWLMTARSAPGMILDSNRESLRQRFLAGSASYYVGYPEEIDVLVERLGEDGLGVAPLPSGPTGSAGPLLGVDALLFSPVSSDNQKALSLELAQFVTNPEQSATFMRDARLIPANTRVRINPRLHPLMAGFLAQARSAIALPSLEFRDEMWSIAASTYSRAMNGLISPLEAALETTAAINELNGLTADSPGESVCTELGTVRLVHDWNDEETAVLDEIIDRFRGLCPLVIVNSEQQDLDAVLAAWASNPGAATNPDLVLATQDWLIQALGNELPFKDISPLVSGEALQRYLPNALAGMRRQNILMGLPVSVRVHVLYYNTSLVDDPAPVLERVRLQADNGLPIVFDARFRTAYWGVGAFGSRMFDAEGRPALDEGGFANWLTWLRQSRDEHGIALVFDPDAAKTAFLDGTSAYYVGEPAERAELAAALGEENLGISLLPAGPEGAATPLFVTSGFLFNESMSESDLAAALAFAMFASNEENQQLLVEGTERVPANATVNLTDEPLMVTVLEQARTAYPLPNDPQIIAVLDLGDQAYQDVLIEGVDPEQAARDLTRQVRELYGGEQGVSELGAPPTQSGELRLATSTPATGEQPETEGQEEVQEERMAGTPTAESVPSE